MTGRQDHRHSQSLSKAPCGLVGLRGSFSEEVMFESCGLNGRQPGEGVGRGHCSREEDLPGEDATSRESAVREAAGSTERGTWNEEEAGLEPSQGPGGSEARRQRWPVLLHAWGGNLGGPRNWEAVEISVAQRKPRVVGLCIRNSFETLILLSLIQVTTGPE